MKNPLAFLARHATWFLAGGIFLGLAWPALARWAAPLVPASVVLLLAATLMRQEVPLLRQAARRWTLLTAALAWQLAGTAAMVFALLAGLEAAGRAAGFDPYGGVGELPAILILAAGCPPILSAIAFALLFRLDAAFTTLLVLGSVFLAPLTLPLVALVLLKAPLGIDTASFMLQLALLVGIAAGIAMAGHALFGRRRIEAHGNEIDGIAVLLIILFGVAIMDGVAARLGEQPWLALLMLAAAVVLAAVTLGASLLLFRAGEKPRTRAIAIAAGNRNLGLLFAALGSAASADLALFVAIGQFPIYFMPLVLRPFYGRTAIQGPL